MDYGSMRGQGEDGFLLDQIVDGTHYSVHSLGETVVPLGVIPSGHLGPIVHNATDEGQDLALAAEKIGHAGG